mgnify:FL=1
MAVEIMVGKNAKIVLDFWTSSKGIEYLTARMFYGNLKGNWFPSKNGMYLRVKQWDAIIPKIRELIYYKTAPPGAPPSFESEEGVEEREGILPEDDF